MIEFELIPVVGGAVFAVASFYSTIATFIHDEPLRQSYTSTTSTTATNTALEYARLVITAVLALASWAAFFLALLYHPTLWSFVFVAEFALSWLPLSFLAYSSLHPDSSAPRHFILPYIIALASQSYYTYSLINPSIASLAINVTTTTLTLLLLIVDIITPVRNAAVIESIKIDGRLPCGEATASIWSLITFSWVNPILKQGSLKPLEEEELPHLVEDDEMKNIVYRWNLFREKSNKKSVVWDLLKFTFSYGIFQILVSIVTTILDFAKPFFINLLLTWIKDRKPDEKWYHGGLLLLGMFVASLIRDILYAQIYLNGRHWGIQLRSIFVYEIFKKSLRRTGGASLADDEAGQKASQGKIVSLMSSDTNQVRYFITDIHSVLIDMPLSIIMSISGLLYIMGIPALAGLAVIVVSGPISTWALSKLYKILKETRILTDKRIQITNEALQGIRIIKYMSWEPQFIKKINDARENELQTRYSLMLNNLLVTTIAWGSTGNQLDAPTAFTSISLLSTVSFALSNVGETVSWVMNIKVTLQRINAFLDEQELVKFGSNQDPDNLDSDAWIGFKDAHFTYHGSTSTPETVTEQTPLLATAATEDSNTFTLRNIDIVFPKRKLTSIIGTTGSGKTSLLLALLGAYVPQTAWLINATIRENILYGEAYDEERYFMVLKACALLRDLDTLNHGDQTEIGEKGVNLSGGQKQRVSLGMITYVLIVIARAAYSSAPIVLLDDPLSAVDAPTARHLLYNCILELFKGRTVILVTHAINLVLPKSEHVVVMKNGSVFAQGSPDAMIADPKVTEVIGKDIENDAVLHSDEIVEEDPVQLKAYKPQSGKEGKATGTVKWKTYVSYITASGGFWFVIGVMMSFAVQTAADYLSNWWIEYWTDSIADAVHTAAFYNSTGIYNNFATQSRELVGAVHHTAATMTRNMFVADEWALEAQPSSLYYISIFGLISFAELFALLFKYVIQFAGGIRASRILHSRLISSVMGSPMRFFETTPVGRKDLSDIDTTVIWTLLRFGTVILGAVARVTIVSTVTPLFACSIFIFFFYYHIAVYYLTSSREIKRIESVSSSPIYAQFGEALIGASSIRAYGTEKKSIREIQEKVDVNHRAFFYLFATNRWLLFRTSVLSAIIVLLAGISIIYAKIKPGWAGVAFNFSSQITNYISNAIQIQSSLEMAMNAVERVDEYSELKQEPFESSDNFEAPANWPSEGKVEVVDVAVKYAPNLPEVLKGLTFTIQPKEKIGIVGRTGAGKSTLSMAFFRILPFVRGTIFIDGIDISKLGLHDLRSKLTIIPQDPILFEGTLRSNLDPLDEHTDEVIWDALRLTHVLESLQTAEDGADIANLSLDSPVNENGGNYSQGQRQLLCMARALLRSSKFIFMDEATASVDPETDSKIQQTIRSEFINGTILTVAHRLKTIVDYDRVLVMDDGKVGEFGTPYELLSNKNGLFHSMCVESGDYEELVTIATNVHNAKTQK
ncbi:hypothetical protein HDV02_003008 [Globomyces sp. JEL0801]|nr:hypothetical protein HDV02_003008 [Globomyces sp. JEL0801]